MYQLSESDFELFKSEANKWIEKFGLKDWSISFAFEHLQDNYAECRYKWLGRIAVLVLSKWMDEETSKEQIRKSAFHEVCELLLVVMEKTALDEAIPYDERMGLTDSARHGVIRRLENSIFQDSLHNG